MFSSRFHWDLRPNRLAAAVAARRTSGAAIFDLTGSNPTRAGFDYPPEVVAALADPRSLIYQPEAAGLASARAAVSAWYAARAEMVEPERILLTASTSEGYAYLFKLLTEPGDEVLVPRPSYPLFDFLATMESVRVQHYPLAYHGIWWLDADALERAITPRTRAVVVVNPNNPTGSYVKLDELARLVEICRAHGLAIISDEVFAGYPLRPDPRRAVTLADVDEVPVFSMSGLSKIAGLPQMKLGWIVASGPPKVRREAMEKLELIADTYLSVSTPVQHAAPALLASGAFVERQIAARLRENLAVFRAAAEAHPACRVLDVEGGWCATLQIPRTRGEEECALALLEQHGVLVQPGFFYDFESEAFLVVSLLTPPEMFREGVGRLFEALRTG
ncbi:MAG TPA: pyridoxal phosphate-dependent aminotransferase [Bryobacteraceae bacterium]|nr:pyridoxal phosphate-dependent aminotransferase [Bryobacteraceae bacterium]